MRTFSDNLQVKCHELRLPGIGGVLIAAGALALAPGLVLAHGDDAEGDDRQHKRGVCTATAKLALKACSAEGRDDLLIASAICLNLSDRDERRDCKEQARMENAEFRELCKEQFDARLEVCDLVGEGAYDPDFDPDAFELGGNTWFPLAVGNRWKYESEFSDEEGEAVTETITVTVLENEADPGNYVTKQIGVTEDSDGVTCLVVNDVVEENGEVIEDTDDWYAREIETGDVWYCGELARDFETFEDDSPPIPELVSIDGSFKPFRDGDQPGILVPDVLPFDSLSVGRAYRQEVSLGNAEDVAQVLSVDYVFGGETGNPESLDYLVPEALAEAFCSAAAPCLVTRDFTPLEPGVEERKYRAQGIGVFLEVNLTDEVIVELKECEVDGISCPSL
jgi:hypothetical protein